MGGGRRAVRCLATVAIVAVLPMAQVPGVRAATPQTLSSDVLATCATPARQAVVDGQPIVVRMPPASPFTVGSIDPSWWRNPQGDDNWQLHFDGFSYLPPLAARAYQDGQAAALGVMVDQLVAFHAQNPDQGTNAYGWDEGTAMQRLATENCLYLLTGDDRLRPLMHQDAAVQLGYRYYGPPLHSVHNHGLMANLALIRAGQLLSVPPWAAIGSARLRAEALLAFSPRGTTWEQSSAYQLFNVSLWRQAAQVLGARRGQARTVAALQDVIARADRVSQWLTEPDGRLVQIGDADASPGVAGTGTPGVFRDDAAGYVVGRWSWTDPQTTYYTLRYGPPRTAHGQLDRGSVTWSVAGARVLVGPGRYQYNSTPFALWRSTAAAHNLALPLTGTYRPHGGTWIGAATVQGKAHAWLLVDTLYGVRHTRGVNVNGSTHRLEVIDGYGGRPFEQVWHLDPAWSLVHGAPGANRLLFRHPNGRTLLVTTSGRAAALVRGSTSPVAGWTFPTYGVAQPAYQLVIRSVGRSVDTLFRIA